MSLLIGDSDESKDGESEGDGKDLDEPEADLVADEIFLRVG